MQQRLLTQGIVLKPMWKINGFAKPALNLYMGQLHDRRFRVIQQGIVLLSSIALGFLLHS